MNRWRHGTAYGYDQKGCRCEKCRAAKLLARREARQRARSLRTPAYLRELESTRLRKMSYRGTCVDCGGPTSGCNGPTITPERCQSCRNIYQATELKVWTQETVVAAIRRWAKEHDGQPPTATDWHWAREGYPAATAIYRHASNDTAAFGSWGEAIEAAGFPRPRQGQRPGENWWTPDLVITELQRRAHNGIAPGSHTEYNLARAARQFFGSWSAACSAAGLRTRSDLRAKVAA